MKSSDRIFDLQPETVTKDIPLQAMKVSHDARDKFIYGSYAYGYTFPGLTRALQSFSPRIRLKPDKRQYLFQSAVMKLRLVWKMIISLINEQLLAYQDVQYVDPCTFLVTWLTLLILPLSAIDLVTTWLQSVNITNSLDE